MINLTRRGLLAASALALIASQFHRQAAAQAAALALNATARTIDVMDRAATVLGVEGPSGPGQVLSPGQDFAWT